MSSNRTAALARLKIAEFVVFLTGVTAFWFAINPNDHGHGFSLCSRFGMTQRDYEALLVAANLAVVDATGFRLLPQEWTQFIGSGHFIFLKDKPSLDKKRTELQAHVEGRTVSKDKKKRGTYHTIRIGREAKGYHVNSLLDQKDANGKLKQKPPPLRQLKSKQRAFSRTVMPLIFQATYQNDHLYNMFMADDEQPRAPQKVLTPSAPLTPTRVDLETPARPTKKIKLGMGLDATPSPQVPSKATPSPQVPSNNIPTSSSHPETPPPASNDFDPKKFPLLSEFKKMWGDKCDDTTWDLLFVELTRMMRNGSVVTATDTRNKEQSWVQVPVNSTDGSHAKQAKGWLGEAIKINGLKDGQEFDSARRACNYLAIHHPESMMASLKEKQYPVVEYMNETKLAAMWDDSNVNFTQEEAIQKHLRAHFGKKAFATRKKVRMLCDGHTHVSTGSAQHAYEVGEEEETLEFSYKDIPLELEKQIAARLQGSNIDITTVTIVRIDIVTGGDHGQGAFQAGCQVVIVFSDKDDLPSIVFDIGVAEVICRKDNSEVLQATIGPHLTAGYQGIVDKELTIGLNEDGEIKCSFGNGDGLSQKMTPTKEVYVVGDLAFYAMVLGREHSSGSRCYLCRMSAKEFAKALKRGEAWTYELMNDLVSQMQNGKPLEGCKQRAWWQMIKLANYLVPLLHELIGIGNDIYDNFRDYVNEEIECLDPKEVATRRKVGLCEKTIDAEAAKRDGWDNSVKGTKLKSLKGMIYRRNTALSKLGVITSPAAPAASSRSDCIDDLLAEIDEYVETDDATEDDDVVTDGGTATQPTAAATVAANTNSNIKKRIAKYQKEIKEKQAEMKPLKDERDVIAKDVTKGRALLARLKKKLTEFRSTRKKSKDGIESQMLRVLKIIGVELTRYHGGSLAGMDIKKVIANASFVFDEFAKILKAGKKEDSVSDDDIDEVCRQHKQLFVLWDGAFAAARTINPTEEDHALYSRFVTAAVNCHIKVGCSVTHKVHLMGAHVAWQMRTIPGGLGEKMEDWVELQHQSGSRARKRFRTTKDLVVRATARARAEHRGTNAGVIAQREAVKEEFRRNFKDDGEKESREVVRKAKRESTRMAALVDYECRLSAATKIERWWLMWNHRPTEGSDDVLLR